MELFFLHANNDKVTGDIWRRKVYDLAAQKDFTYKLYAINHKNGCKNIPLEEMKMISLAFICIDLSGSLEIGKELYNANPFCRIVYYGNGKKDIIPFLSSRPVFYADTSESAFDIYKCIEDEYEKMLYQTGVYLYEDKFHNICIPYSAILYFNTKNRLTYIQTVAGEKGPIRKNLDVLETEMEKGCFIRCHKSYLIMKKACVAFDKSNKELILNNGVTVNVSRPYWKDIIEIFCKKSGFEC